MLVRSFEVRLVCEVSSGQVMLVRSGRSGRRVSLGQVKSSQDR